VRGVRLPYGRRVAACRNHGIAGAGRAFSTQPPMDREPEGYAIVGECWPRFCVNVCVTVVDVTGFSLLLLPSLCVQHACVEAS